MSYYQIEMGKFRAFQENQEIDFNMKDRNTPALGA